MTATLIDGKKLANQVQEEVRVEVEALGKSGIRPGLAVVLVGDDPASASYVGMKARTCQELGMGSKKVILPESTTEEELLGQVRALNADDSIDGILVQLPLPEHINKHRILESVDPVKDVDGFHSSNIGSLVLGHERLVACTPLGVLEMLQRSGVKIEGARAAVLGRSDDVGKPMAMLLMHRNATVTICHSRTRDLASIAREADIIVAAIGRAAMVTRDFIKPGAAVIDVGTNQVSERAEVERIFGANSPRLEQFDKRGYIWAGDVHEKDALEVASLLSPVPGGAGPMTIAMLMKNTITGARLRRGL